MRKQKERKKKYRVFMKVDLGKVTFRIKGTPCLHIILESLRNNTANYSSSTLPPPPPLSTSHMGTDFKGHHEQSSHTTLPSHVSITWKVRAARDMICRRSGW